jgi:potassium-dependent mechanosensitive channel
LRGGFRVVLAEAAALCLLRDTGFRLRGMGFFVVSRFLRFVLDEDVYYRWRLSQGIPQAISTVIHYAILLIGFFVALAAIGGDLTKVTILAGAFTVGVGFGL